MDNILINLDMIFDEAKEIKRKKKCDCNEPMRKRNENIQRKKGKKILEITLPSLWFLTGGKKKNRENEASHNARKRLEDII